MVLDPGSAGWSFMQDPPEQKITAHQATARLPLAEGLCPECGKPANYNLGTPLIVLHTDAVDHQACPLVIEATVAVERMLRAYRDLMPSGDAPALGITTHVGDPAIADAEPIIYEQIVELFNRVMANREYWPDPSPPPIPPVAATLLTDPAKHLGSLGP